MAGSVRRDGNPRDVKIGAHSVRFEEPDFYLAIYSGDVSGEEALAVARELSDFAQGKPYLLGIADATHVGSVSAEARRAFLQFPSLIRGTAFIGVSPALRLVGSIIARAYRLVHRAGEQPRAFFSTEREARAWIDERRKELEAEGQPQPP